MLSSKQGRMLSRGHDQGLCGDQVENVTCVCVGGGLHWARASGSIFLVDFSVSSSCFQNPVPEPMPLM